MKPSNESSDVLHLQGNAALECSTLLLMLSFQKASLATDHCFNFRFFGCNPPTQFVRSPVLATLAKKNTLREVDKINVRTRFAASQYDFHLWADDSKKGGNERHAVGVPHTWNSDSQKP